MSIRRPKLEFTRLGQSLGQQAQNTTSSSGVGSLNFRAPPAIQIKATIPPPAPKVEEKPEERPKAVFWDSQGRLLDDKGNILNLKQSTELKINQKNQLQTANNNRVKDLLKMKKYGEIKAMNQEMMLSKRKFFDPALDSKLNKRDRKKSGAFNFVQEGTFVKRGEILRKKQVIQEYEEKQKNAAAAESEESKQAEAQLRSAEVGSAAQESDGKIHLRKTGYLRAYDAVPDIEWWDAQFLPPQKGNTENGESIVPKRFPVEEINDEDIYLEKITHYVQHPKKLKNDFIEKIEKTVVPIHLTEKEKKKLRQQKRLDKEKDKQEKIKLGLLPTPPPKVKLSNYMKIMAKEAIADPSRVEQKVRSIVEQRLQTHLTRNQTNKLTRDQREAKMKRKHERDIAQNECRIAVFKVENLTQPHLKFKIDMNATQFHMGGFCLIADQTMAPDLPNLVIVEGGPRAIKRFKRLMLRRIDWNSKSKSKKVEGEEGNEEVKEEPPVDDQEEDEDKIKNSKDRKCFLIWEGVQKKKTFERWRIVDVRSENEAKRLLNDKGCEQFWNMAITFQPERAEGEEPESLEKVLA
ncbi:hypothetical protein FGO68_gene10507 [Halteria grandinella]|uniref:Uncharacterized protein n=1 Tax=Halteria grandinella TaxID=5974 RepID=A0A8J8NTY8_HALGN|nr:hypothetical protein FGO68_gene10507 [Halteria grandinella]